MRFRKYIRVGGKDGRVRKSISFNGDVYQNDVKKDMLIRIEKRIDKEIQQQIYRRYGVVC